jgi:hypothetical protein
MVLPVYKWMIFFLFPLFRIPDSAKIRLTKDVRHPFYVSVTEINTNATAKTLEISCKFFSNDLEQIIEKDYKTQLDITLEKYKADFDKYIPDYVAKHLQLIVNGKQVVINYIGFEMEKQSAYTYFEVSNITTLKTINITNRLLYDFTDQQINIMHITVSDKRQSTKLNYPDSQAAFSF